MKKIIPFLLVCTVFFLSCKKEVDELPPATQTGAHTFGARVNGALWTPQGFGPFPANDILEAVFTDIGELKLYARNFSSSPTETEFEIYVKGITGPGTYPLNLDATLGGNMGSYGYYVRRKLTPEDEWITNSVNTGSVTITKIDTTTSRFISGVFEFRARSMYNASDILTVTDGRFDVRLH